MPWSRCILVCAALVALLSGAGCAAGSPAAGAAPPAEWTRDPRLDPWRPIGVSPDARWIRHAVHQGARYRTFDECPLRLLPCGREDLPREALQVDEVRCAAVAESTDRCSFRLTETQLGENGEHVRSVRSRCTGHFVPVGTSHSPWEWALAWVDVPPPSCRRSR